MLGIELSELIFACGLLTLATNVITQVLKDVFDAPAQLTALITAVTLSVLSFFVYAAVAGIAVKIYMVGSAAVMGFFVAYAAMYGFDTLKELIDKYTGGRK